MNLLDSFTTSSHNLIINYSSESSDSTDSDVDTETAEGIISTDDWNGYK